MKILEVVSCFPPSRGGVEKCVYELSTRFANYGHQVTVATSTRGKKLGSHAEKMDGMTVVRFPEKYHLFEAPLIPRISLMALMGDYDLLHVHGMCPTITDLSILFASMRGKPIVLTYHNDAESQQWGPIAKVAAFVYASIVSLLIRKVGVVVSSTHSYAATSVALKYSLDKLRIIPMGVDLGKYELVDGHAGENAARNLLFVGQLREYKGVNVLLDAISLLNSQGQHIKVNIVGTGPELQNLRRMAKNLSVENNVCFLGNVSDQELIQLYSTCDSVVLPSLNRREAFGIVLLEAMAAGKNIVASDIPGVNEIATKAGGFLARPNDAHSLAQSIIQSIANKRPSETVRMVAQDHSWDKLAAEYESIFEKLTRHD